ncbi:MAG TPA: hypothetical protein VLK60_00985, partial [Variovorax sp.]|nr:hypothetical protein [Variovorax sp.]
ATWTTAPVAEGGARARPGEAVHVHGSVRASYFHAWFASDPEATARLFDAAPLDFTNDDDGRAATAATAAGATAPSRADSPDA